MLDKFSLYGLLSPINHLDDNFLPARFQVLWTFLMSALVGYSLYQRKRQWFSLLTTRILLHSKCPCYDSLSKLTLQSFLFLTSTASITNWCQKCWALKSMLWMYTCLHTFFFHIHIHIEKYPAAIWIFVLAMLYSHTSTSYLVSICAYNKGSISPFHFQNE